MANDKNEKTSWGKQVVLPAKAKPTPYQTLAFEEVDSFRCLGCLAYSTCLDWANMQRWESFTCAECPFYEDGGIAPSLPVNPFMKDPEEMI